LTQVITLVGQVGIVAAYHPTIRMAEQVGYSRDRNSTHQRSGRETVSIRIAHHVISQLELLSQSAEAASNGVSVPGLSIPIPKERPGRMALHQSS
jgi:hypothetical protein